jgi:peptidyl-prolyl cis-trans isomerase B (cyclophilin B)
MVRLTCIILGVVSVSPFGCPSSGTFDNTPVGTITVTADASQTAAVGDQVTLHATATATPDGGPIQYAWFQTAGPGAAVLDANQPVARFVAPSLKTEQTLTFTVTAFNEAGAIGQAEVRVTVGADANFKPFTFPSTGGAPTATGPSADAGIDQVVNAGDVVALDGSGSKGSGLKYSWRQLSGPTVTLAGADTVRATFTAPAFAAGGTNQLSFELTVTDRENHSVTDQMSVTISNPNVSQTEVVISTTMGDFTIQLDPNKAPVTVRNFLQYVDDQFYDGTIFHRVIAGFVVQGGGFTPGLNEKTTRPPIINEASNGLKNVRGSVAMARTNDPNSATAQWYVNLVDNADLDFTATSPGYCVFGQVISGMDVVDRIATVQTGSRSGFQDVPVTDVIVRTARRVALSTTQPAAGTASRKNP